MPMPDVAARAEYWGVKVRKVSAHDNPSHFQVWGRTNRAYFGTRYDTAFWDRAPARRKRLVVAGTPGANVRRVSS